MEIVKLVINGRPYSVNQAYAKGPSRGRGKTNFYMRPEAKAYMHSVAWQARSQYQDKPLTDDLEVEYIFYFGDAKIHDQKNYTKQLDDALEQIVWKNDNQIKISHIYTMIDTNNPRVEIKITKINNKK